MTTNYPYTELDLSGDTIDVREIISRFEELESQSHEWKDDESDADAWHELNTLKAILEELKGQGGDEQWQGDWYPVTLISEIYFVEYAQELCEECGDISENFPSYIVIDWEMTARNLQMDYSSVEIDGLTYYFR